jgi:hypothetical protein
MVNKPSGNRNVLYLFLFLFLRRGAEKTNWTSSSSLAFSPEFTCAIPWRCWPLRFMKFGVAVEERLSIVAGLLLGVLTATGGAVGVTRSSIGRSWAIVDVET